MSHFLSVTTGVEILLRKREEGGQTAPEQSFRCLDKCVCVHKYVRQATCACVDSMCMCAQVCVARDMCMCGLTCHVIVPHQSQQRGDNSPLPPPVYV